MTARGSPLIPKNRAQGAPGTSQVTLPLTFLTFVTHLHLGWTLGPTGLPGELSPRGGYGERLARQSEVSARRRGGLAGWGRMTCSS